MAATKTETTAQDIKVWFAAPSSTWMTASPVSLGEWPRAERGLSESENLLHWEGILAVLGVASADGRYLVPERISHRELPLPLLVQTEVAEGHEGAAIAGRIDAIQYIPASEFTRGEEFALQELPQDAVIVYAWGTLDDSDVANDAVRMVENGAGVSVDIVPERLAFIDPETHEEVQEEDLSPEGVLFGHYLVGIEGKIAAATIVSIPAFEQAAIVFARDRVIMASAYGLRIESPGTLTAAAAGQAPLKPPREWFFLPEPDEPTPLTVTEEGQVFGHLALWNQCHTAFAFCERPPRSQSEYAYFHIGQIETAEGELINVGRITVGEPGNARGGHASVVLGRQGAIEHYDNAGCVVAFVRAIDGKLGPWLSGAVRSDAPAERIRDLRANPPSGDWRDGELVAVLSVPVPGFPIPRTEFHLLASGVSGEEHTETLIATGYIPGVTSAPRDDDYRVRLERLVERRRALISKSVDAIDIEVIIPYSMLFDESAWDEEACLFFAHSCRDAAMERLRTLREQRLEKS